VALGKDLSTLIAFSGMNAAAARAASTLLNLSHPLSLRIAFALASPNSRSPQFVLYWAGDELALS